MPRSLISGSVYIEINSINCLYFMLISHSHPLWSSRFVASHYWLIIEWLIYLYRELNDCRSVQNEMEIITSDFWEKLVELDSLRRKLRYLTSLVLMKKGFQIEQIFITISLIWLLFFFFFVVIFLVSVFEVSKIFFFYFF